MNQLLNALSIITLVFVSTLLAEEPSEKVYALPGIRQTLEQPKHQDESISTNDPIEEDSQTTDEELTFEEEAFDEPAIVLDDSISDEAAEELDTSNKNKDVSTSDPQDEIINGLGYYDTYFPDYHHWISSISVIQDELLLEDDSRWVVNPSDRYKLSNWLSNKDPIEIAQNDSYFSRSQYPYRLINRALSGSYVNVGMMHGPLRYGQNTNVISDIDYFNGIVYLSNDTSWNLSPAYKDYYYKWQVNDTIIIGVNNAWWPSYEFILINIEEYKHVPANKFLIRQ